MDYNSLRDHGILTPSLAFWSFTMGRILFNPSLHLLLVVYWGFFLYSFFLPLEDDAVGSLGIFYQIIGGNHWTGP